MLVAGAGLMLRSFYELVSEGVGFDTEHLLTLEVDLPQQRYPNGDTQSRFFHQLARSGARASGRHHGHRGG